MSSVTTISRLVALAAAVTSATAAAGCLGEPQVQLFDPPGSKADGGDPATTLAADASTSDARSTDADDGRTSLDACNRVCTRAGGSCAPDGTCVFTCPGAAPCLKGVVCPAGVACRVDCLGNQVCGTIDCAQASTCAVQCRGDQACTGDVKAPTGQSTIDCSGNEACHGHVSCAGDRCAVTCVDGGCKPSDVHCCALLCLVNGAPGTCG